MKLLLVSSSNFFSTYGGGQVYVKNIADEMIRQGMNITIISRNRDSKEIVKKSEYRGSVVYIFNSEAGKDVIMRVVSEDIRPDIIHAHGEKALFCTIGHELNIPVVVTAHHGGITCPAGTLLNCKDEICKLPVSHQNCLPCVLRNTKTGTFFYPLLKFIPLAFRLKTGKILAKLPFIYFVTPILSADLHIENKQKEWDAIIENVDKMIAPSYAIADNMILNGLPKEKIEIVPHGIPAIVRTKNSSLSRNEKLKFFYVGRIGRIKGIHLLLKAFSQLDASRCELHIIGDISNNKDAQQWIRQYKKFDNIIFHGKINPDKVSGFIRNLDVLVHAAICMEVFGLNISEALWEGKPVIATRCGGAEMQIDDSNGWLIEPNNEEELRNLLAELVRNPQLIKEKSIHAGEKVISIERHVCDLNEIYKGMDLINRFEK